MNTTLKVAVVVALSSIGACVAVVLAGERGGGSTGACCFSNGDCAGGFTQIGCMNQGGNYQGDGTSCPRGVDCGPFGACCIAVGVCQSGVSQDFCESELQGVWAGPETICTKQPGVNVNTIGQPLGPGTLCLGPENDHCENAIHIDSLGESVYGSNAGSTEDIIPDCEAGSRGFDKFGVWYSVTGTGSVLRASVCGLDEDTNAAVPRSVLFVYCGGCENLQCVAGDGGILQSCAIRTLDAVEWCSVLGEEYLILVALEGEATADFRLYVEDTQQPCKGSSCTVPNDECEDAICIDSLGVVYGTTQGATHGFEPACANPTIDSNSIPDVWYKVIGTGESMSAELCMPMNGNGRGNSGGLNVYCGTCPNLNCVVAEFGPVFECDSDLLGKELEVDWCSEEGREYFIRVSFPDSESMFVLEVESDGKPCEPEPCGTAQNDFCEDAQPICPGVIYTGDTFTATNDYLDHGAPINTVFFCGALMALYDVWYSYTPAEAGLLFVHVEQLPTEWVFGVYDDCPENGGVLLKCNIVRHHGVIIVPVQPFQTYYIRIAGFLESRGEYFMDILGPPCAGPMP